MKLADTKLKKTILIVTGAILIAVTVVIIFISPIAKHLVEKYGEKYTGRHIKMSWMYVNPFTGYVHISHLKIYESKTFPSYKTGDSIFFSADGLSVNFAMLKLFSKTIEISEITLDKPRGIVIQKEQFFNFTDLINTFTPKQPSTTPSKFHFNLLGIRIENGTFYYREDVTPINYFIREANFESKGKPWNIDTLQVKYSFSSGPGSGTAKGIFTINFKTLAYRLEALVQKFDLTTIEQYLRGLSNYGSFRAILDADVKATGNFQVAEVLNARGLLALNDLHFGKNPKEDYASCDNIVLKIDQLNPVNHIYNFDSLSVSHPILKYERYDSLDNMQRMFGQNGTKISSEYENPSRFNLILEIAKYVKALANNFFESDFRIKRIAIYRGDLKFNDFSISEKFSVAASPLFILADSINKNLKRVNVNLKSNILPYGYITVQLSIDPKNKDNFDLQGNLTGIPASVFNPYLISYSSYNLDRGTLEFKGTWNVRSGIIQSVNHLVIIDPRQTKRVRNKDTKWLPIPLIMALVRERGNVIDYEIPITGNLKDPKFHLHDVLVDLIKNIFVKPATTPYRLEVKNMETEIEKFHALTWKIRQRSLLPVQEIFVNKMVDYLVKNPEATISVYPVNYTEKEKEHILFFEAKKKYFLLLKGQNGRSLNEDDSLSIDKMSVKDNLFVHFLNNKTGEKMLFTIQEKCKKYIDPAVVDAKFKQLQKEREEAFMSDFNQKGVQNRVKMQLGENNIPYDGFSYFKIDYKGGIPEEMVKAYNKMNELNGEPPRKKFKNNRKKINTDVTK